MTAILFLITILLPFLLAIALIAYGTYLCFAKSWVYGLIALLVPGFAPIVAIFKLFKKDILS